MVLMYHKCMTKIIMNNQMQIDQRTHLTHRKLMIALQAHFAAQMPFNKLTVKQLCHDAHVGRATFYRHHQDIADIIVVEYLITLQELGHALNNLENPTYATIAGAVITTMRAHLDLPQLAAWAHCADRVLPLETGFAQQLLTALAIQAPHQHFIATFLGHSCHQFAWQLATTQHALNRIETYRLFIQLVPNVLQTPTIPTDTNLD